VLTVRLARQPIRQHSLVGADRRSFSIETRTQQQEAIMAKQVKKTETVAADLIGEVSTDAKAIAEVVKVVEAEAAKGKGAKATKGKATKGKATKGKATKGKATKGAKATKGKAKGARGPNVRQYGDDAKLVLANGPLTAREGSYLAKVYGLVNKAKTVGAYRAAREKAGLGDNIGGVLGMLLRKGAVTITAA
jgi:hypothetical protein